MTNKEASEELKEEFEIFKTCIHKADWDNPNEELKKVIEANTMAIEVLGQQPCDDAVSREAVNELIDELARAISDERCFMSRGRATSTIMQDILDLPSVTPKQKVGKWIFHKPFDNGHKNCNECIECSQCHTWFGHDYYEKTPYCPNCGADMRGEAG